MWQQSFHLSRGTIAEAGRYYWIKRKVSLHRRDCPIQPKAWPSETKKSARKIAPVPKSLGMRVQDRQIVCAEA